MDQLSKAYLKTQRKSAETTMESGVLETFPEKILQFGTGGFIRAFADYLVNEANRQGIFKGSVLVVKSTPGNSDSFDEQDNLYTINIKNQHTDQKIISSAISRVLNADEDWQYILEAAANPQLNIIISNTTEAGLQYQPEDLINNTVPKSYPGKLTAFLYERYQKLRKKATEKTIVLPCELLVNNGTLLEEMVQRLARENQLPQAFIKWLSTEVRFCNTIVDRIVPGKPSAEHLPALFESLGYKDELFLEAEPYLLWGIEIDKTLQQQLSFTQVHDGVIITDNIEPFREQKLRLLNGTHTFSIPLAFLSGLNTVYEASQDAQLSRYIRQLMQQEIAPTLEGISPQPAEYAQQVFERFQNPFIQHKLISITFQHSTKMLLRNSTTIDRYFKKSGKVPAHMALGFAAFLLFMKSEKAADGSFHGSRNDKNYTITDDNAAYFCEKWENNTDLNQMVKTIIAEQKYLSDTDQIISFADKTSYFLNLLLKNDASKVLDGFLNSVNV